MNQYLQVPRARYNELLADTEALDVVLDQGAEKARVVAQRTMSRVMKAMLNPGNDSSPNPAKNADKIVP